MKHNIIFHNQDLDGFCSGAIIKHCLLNKGVKNSEIKMTGWNYGNTIPNLMGQVYITDICFPDEVMESLTDKTVWIDHHKTSIESSRDKWDILPGSRKIGDSASLLAWEYFFEGEEIPEVVKYVDLYDVWKKGIVPWAIVIEAQFGMRFYLNNPEKFTAYQEWALFLDLDTEMKKVFETGRLISKYIKEENKVISLSSFDIKFEGLDLIAVNRKGNSETLKSVVTKDHDGIMLFYFDKNKWRVSLYNNELNKNTIDLSVISKKFGGGGHAKACGFECKNLPFMRENKELSYVCPGVSSKEVSEYLDEIKHVKFNVFKIHIDELKNELESLSEAIQFIDKRTPTGWTWERFGTEVIFNRE